MIAVIVFHKIGTEYVSSYIRIDEEVDRAISVNVKPVPYIASFNSQYRFHAPFVSPEYKSSHYLYGRKSIIAAPSMNLPHKVRSESFNRTYPSVVADVQAAHVLCNICWNGSLCNGRSEASTGKENSYNPCVPKCFLCHTKHLSVWTILSHKHQRHGNDKQCVTTI